MLTPHRPTIVDLFCGCSGFGLGARQAGFDIPLSIDIDPVLTSAHSANFKDSKLVLTDIAKIHGSTIREEVGEVDGIIGGPPCQGFSSIGRSDPLDPRRELLTHFFRVVAEVKPRFFMMENVKGLVFQKNRHMLDNALAQLPSNYTVLDPVVIDAADYGAATKRERVFVVGYDAEQVSPLNLGDIVASQSQPTTVRDAIGDLVSAEVVSESADVWKYSPNSEVSSYARHMRSASGQFTLHRKTPHKVEIVERFASVQPGSVDKVGRHPRLAWHGQCPTLRAGTGADKGSYQAVRPIHPTEPRVITVREAARLQGFPDDFIFHPTVWHSFRMIGNSVSPIVSRSLLSLLLSRLEHGSIAAE